MDGFRLTQINSRLSVYEKDGILVDASLIRVLQGRYRDYIVG